MTADDKPERTEAGDEVLRYGDAKEGFAVADTEVETLEAIENHFSRHIGTSEYVFHEIASDIVHIDVHWIEPTPERNYHTLYTTGMSDLPMQGPDGEYYAELMVSLPADWPISDKAFDDQSNYWPVGTLTFLARLPHLYDTWLGWGHSIPNGDPAEPYAANTGFTGVILYHSAIAPEEFNTLKIDDDKTIEFFTLFPVYADEMNLKLKRGAKALLRLLLANGVTDVIDIRRDGVRPSGFWHRLLGRG